MGNQTQSTSQKNQKSLSSSSEQNKVKLMKIKIQEGWGNGNNKEVCFLTKNVFSYSSLGFKELKVNWPKILKSFRTSLAAQLSFQQSYFHLTSYPLMKKKWKKHRITIANSDNGSSI